MCGQSMSIGHVRVLLVHRTLSGTLEGVRSCQDRGKCLPETSADIPEKARQRGKIIRDRSWRFFAFHFSG